MYHRIIFIGLLFFVNHSLLSQQKRLIENSLFYSALEKQAFESTNIKSGDPLIFLVASDETMNLTRYHQLRDELMAYSAKLEARRNRFNSEDFLQYVFSQIHKQYLRNYDYPEPFTGIFNKGHYNCVSGAALYAFVLNELGYSPELYETRFHMFLILRTSDGDNVMYESTDPLNGFIADSTEISKRINNYLEMERVELSDTTTLAPPFHTKPLLNKITLKELAGLHYYNIAANALNESDPLAARYALLKAQVLYPRSERIAHLLELTKIIAKSNLKISFN